MPYDVPHAVSPGLWALAWRRLRSDRVAMVSLAIVAAFLVMIVLSATGLIAKDWAREEGVNYAPPTFVGPDAAAPPASAVPGATVAGETGAAENESDLQIVDPLADALAAIKAGATKPGEAPPPAAPDTKSVDPLADVMADIKAKGAGRTDQVAARAPTLPFGGDKWGRDVLKKVIKGSQTSIFVGIAAAIVAVFLGSVFGAVAGYYGKWLDDVFNWFYSVFTAIPYLLLILAVAAVLQQKGTLTIILILGLTGWTGVFRLIRGEYLKHKGREYVQAADAIGASNARRMFVHILPNVSHVVLVQLSILTVAFIKSEVILSFLGFGVPVDVVSWGSMLNEAQNELILGKWWQLAAAGTFMALLVTAFSLFTDALRDALDPKLK
ncbi:MAG TPA: ABC transporter permease [Casimicrobiaceae bacterium]|jgi:peptide/nickel transport system permease protein|nr:ABC transporter permease [Casimicrobiaceae bacterium]